MRRYPADAYEFYVTSQDADGPLPPPKGEGWALIATNAAEDPMDGGLAAILIATWARRKVTEGGVERKA